MLDFDLDSGWDVDKDSENLNKSLFGGGKKKKNKKKSETTGKQSLNSGNLLDSDEETFTKKGLKKLKEQRRKEKKKKNRDGAEEVTNDETIETEKPVKKNISNKKNKSKEVEDAKVDANGLKKLKKRKRKSSETDAGEDLPSSPPKKSLKKGKENQTAEKEAHEAEEGSDKKKKRKRKKKNNSKPNKYAHLAIIDQSKENRGNTGEESSSKNSVSKKENFHNNVPNVKSVTNPKKENCRSHTQTSLMAAENSSKKRKANTLEEQSEMETIFKKKIISIDSAGKQNGTKLNKKKKNKVDASNLESKAPLNEKTGGVKKSDASVDFKSTSQSNSELNNRAAPEKLNQLLQKQKSLQKMLQGKEAGVNNSNGEGSLQDNKDKNKKNKKDKSAENLQSSDNPKDNKVKGNEKSGNISSDKVKDKSNMKPGVKQEVKDVTPEIKSVWGKAAGMAIQARERLNAARFRYLNEQLYMCPGSDALRMFREDKEAFKVYHAGFEKQASEWPVNPVNVLIKQLKDRPKNLVIADFGCGDAKLEEALPQKVHSFDLVALNPRVIACDMTKVPLEPESVDIAVFCLSLMGTNMDDYIKEASRVLKMGGLLKIVEVVSRFRGLSSFTNSVCNHGYQLLNKRDLSQMFYMMDFKKVKDVKKVKRSGKEKLSLKPCVYKKR